MPDSNPSEDVVSRVIETIAKTQKIPAETVTLDKTARRRRRGLISGVILGLDDTQLRQVISIVVSQQTNAVRRIIRIGNEQLIREIDESACVNPLPCLLVPPGDLYT